MKIKILTTLLFIVPITNFGCTDKSVKIISSQNLRVEKSGAKGPVIQIEKKEVALGNIPYTTKTITGKIKIKNVGTELLEINDVSGPCSCFAGYLGDKKVAPGKTGEISINFNKEGMIAGMPIKRLAKIRTNDPKNEDVNVYFYFVVQDKPNEKDIRLLPQVLDYGRVSHEKFISSNVVPIQLIIPVRNDKEKVNVEIKPSTNLLSILKMEDSTSKNVDDNSFRRTIIYNLSWCNIPEGLFQEYLTFIIKHQGYGKKLEIKFLIRGDII